MVHEYRSDFLGVLNDARCREYSNDRAMTEFPALNSENTSIFAHYHRDLSFKLAVAVRLKKGLMLRDW